MPKQTKAASVTTTEAVPKTISQSVDNVGKPVGKYPKAKRTPKVPNPDKSSIFNRACEILTSTPRSLRDVCSEPWAPPVGTFLSWRDADPVLAEQYTRAREHQAELLEAEIQAIADDGQRDYVLGPQGPYVDHDHISRSRLRVDTLKWRLARMHPRKYGDKLELAGDQAAPLTIRVVRE